MPRSHEVTVFGQTVTITENDDGTFSLPDHLESLRGFAGALKPAVEPIILARKPLVGTVASNVLTHGTGALNIDACRVDAGVPDGRSRDREGETSNDRRYAKDGRDFHPTPGPRGGAATGRWPSNLVLVHVERAYYHLRDDLDPALIECVHDYFRSFQTVPEVRWPDHRDAVGSGETEVLLAGMPGGAAERGTSGEQDDGVGDAGVPAVLQDVRGDTGVGAERASEVLLEQVPSPSRVSAETPVGEAPHRRGASEDGAGSDRPQGQGTVVAVEGRDLPRQRRVSVGDDRPPASGDSGVRAGDGPDRQAVRDGAPGGDGDHARTPVDPLGDRAPSQRGEGRQPAGEPHAARPYPAQHGAPRGGETVGGVGSGERSAPSRGDSLVVAAEMIPPGWLSYFDRRFTEGCRPTTGVRVLSGVNGVAGPGAYGTGATYGDGPGVPNRGEVVGYGDADGNETIEEWACVPGCPVAALDQQSGEARSGWTDSDTAPSVGYGGDKRDKTGPHYSDTGGASRFFARFAEGIDEQIERDGPVRYVAKAPGKERPSYERLDPPTPMLRLRADLTDEERAHVLERLREAGVDVG